MSVWPEFSGIHAAYNAQDNEMQHRNSPFTKSAGGKPVLKGCGIGEANLPNLRLVRIEGCKIVNEKLFYEQSGNNPANSPS